jgi:allene oxide cyclase
LDSVGHSRAISSASTIWDSLEHYICGTRHHRCSDRHGGSGDSAGDIFTVANEVYDADDKNKIGSDQGICFRTVPGKAWECFWILSLDKGQLTVEGPFYDSGYSVLAITGGTGEFAGALGEMALSARGTKGDAYNFVYRIK